MKFTHIALLTGLMHISIPGNCIEITTKQIDFGNIQEKHVVSYEYNIKNNSRTLLSAGILASCDCITIKPERIDIEPGHTSTLNITIDTAGYHGEFSEKIFIQSNDPINPYITVDVKGTIITQESKKNIHITIFDSPGCRFCKKLRNTIIPHYAQEYNVKIEMREFDVKVPENYEMLMEIGEKNGTKITRLPALFIGNDVITGKKDILKSLPLLIQKYAQAGGADAIELPKTKHKKRLEISKRVKFFPVVAAGIVDSVNPCAFATIIFLLTHLTFILKKERHEVFFAGIAFIVGVFITYLFIGIGFFKVIHELTHIVILSKLMYLVVGVLALFLAYRHMYEAVKIKQSGTIKASDIKLKLPDFAQTAIYTLIKKFTGFKYLVPIIFLLAVLITVLELFCTGQVYLPAIIYLTSITEYRLVALWYLALYCFLFVLPLIIIFSLYYYGLTTEKLKRFFSKHIFSAKIIMSVFFLMLGILVLVKELL